MNVAAILLAKLLLINSPTNMPRKMIAIHQKIINLNNMKIATEVKNTIGIDAINLCLLIIDPQLQRHMYYSRLAES